MAAPNFKNRTLFESDNLPILLGMDTETVDLIATDPPFKKDKKFQGIGSAEGQTMKDTWSWHGSPPGSSGKGMKSDIHKEWLDHIREHWPALDKAVQAAYHTHSPSMAAFLAFMSVRLIEMHRILKPTGSLYLHCDPTANSYLRIMLDAIFGASNFRNEVVWHYGKMSNSSKNFPANHDTILRYTKSDEFTFRPIRGADSEYKKRYKNFLTGQQVLYGSVKHKTDKLVIGRAKRVRKELGRELIDSDVLFDFDIEFKIQSDVIYESIIKGNAKERTGWTTQKPLALYRRFVEASSNEHDIVFDPFCGCATTCVAAEQLDRQWVGIDQSPKAKSIVKDRLAREVTKSLAWNDQVTVCFSAPHRTDVRKLLPPTFSLPPVSEKKGRRKKKKSNVPSYDRNEMRVHLALRDGHYCQGCGMLPPTMPGSLSPELEYLDIDHIVPRSDAGSDNENNLCLLCPPCNRRKAHIWTLAQLRQANQRTKKMLDSSKLKKELEKAK